MCRIDHRIIEFLDRAQTPLRARRIAAELGVERSDINRRKNDLTTSMKVRIKADCRWYIPSPEEVRRVEIGRALFPIAGDESNEIFWEIFAGLEPEDVHWVIDKFSVLSKARTFGCRVVYDPKAPQTGEFCKAH